LANVAIRIKIMGTATLSRVGPSVSIAYSWYVNSHPAPTWEPSMKSEFWKKKKT